MDRLAELVERVDDFVTVLAENPTAVSQDVYIALGPLLSMYLLLFYNKNADGTWVPAMPVENPENVALYRQYADTVAGVFSLANVVFADRIDELMRQDAEGRTEAA